MRDDIRSRFDEHLSVVRLTEEHLAGRIERAVEVLTEALKAGGGVLIFGNGGSAADAQHFACELVGRFLRERPAMRAEALGPDSATLTSIANDYGYEQIFARQVLGKGRPGDVAVGLSTSGNSANVCAGLAAARQAGMKTIALTGSGGGQCAELADVLLDVPSRQTPRIQEAHAVVYHIICEMVERQMATG
jgi:D-sedoheptulose 7-phosphate isomerase